MAKAKKPAEKQPKQKQPKKKPRNKEKNVAGVAALSLDSEIAVAPPLTAAMVHLQKAMDHLQIAAKRAKPAGKKKAAVPAKKDKASKTGPNPALAAADDGNGELGNGAP
ncbi:MAG: hypothetical protein WDN28_12545 [Chthoniobacter sp.]